MINISYTIAIDHSIAFDFISFASEYSIEHSIMHIHFKKRSSIVSFIYKKNHYINILRLLGIVTMVQPLHTTSIIPHSRNFIKFLLKHLIIQVEKQNLCIFTHLHSFCFIFMRQLELPLSLIVG